MSQYDFATIDPDQTDGVELAQLLEQFRDALNSMHSGSAAPTYAVKGTLWLDTSATPHPINISDGSDWIHIGDLNPTTNIFQPNLAGVGLGALAYKNLVATGDLEAGFVLGIGKGGTGGNTAAAARNALGLAIGMNIQGFHANLAAEAGLVGAANKLSYYTDEGTKALTDLSPFGRSLIDDGNADTALSTLGVSAFIKALLNAADSEAAQTALGITGGGAWEPIAIAIPNNTATFIDFEVQQNLYGQFLLVWDEVGNNSADVLAQIRFYGGALYTSGYRDCCFYVSTSGGISAYASTNRAGIFLGNGAHDNNSIRGTSGHLIISADAHNDIAGVGDGRRMHFHGVSGWGNTNGAYNNGVIGGASYIWGGPLGLLRIASASGNLRYGVIRLFGMRDTV